MVVGIICVLPIAAVYLSYYLWACRRGYIPAAKASTVANIAIVVATHNEQKMIGRKFEDLFRQRFDSNKMAILLIDDASTDKTVELTESILRKNPIRHITIIREPVRRGKSHAVNVVLRELSPQYDIIIFSDADVTLHEDAVENLVADFEDRTIGAACGKQIIVNRDQTTLTRMEYAYRGIYDTMRIAESNADSTPIFHGELAAFRSDLVRGERIPEDVNADDAALAMTVRRKGYRVVFDQTAIFYELAPPDSASQNAQKTRRAQGLIRQLWRNRDMLFKSKYGIFGTWIFPVNFAMHIIFPILAAFAAVFLIAGYAYFVLESGNLVLLIGTLLTVFLIWLAISKGRVRRGILMTLITFASYQLFLLRAILLIVARVKLYKWEVVETVRSPA